MLLSIILSLVILGVLLWVIETLIPMDAAIKQVIRVVVVLAVVLWLIGVFLPGIHTPLLR
jgi:low temperature requirement protein LtrA